jgi:hypothetical protein
VRDPKFADELPLESRMRVFTARNGLHGDLRATQSNAGADPANIVGPPESEERLGMPIP